jgi:hypothetical protein
VLLLWYFSDKQKTSYAVRPAHKNLDRIESSSIIAT